MGLISLTATEAVIYTLVMTHITIASITIFLHRCQAHKSLTLTPGISHFFRFWLWLTTSMLTKQWVAVHRKHHAKCETEQDPHSPVILGVWNVVFKGVKYYRIASHDQETLDRYGSGTPNDFMERFYERHHYKGVTFLLFFNIIMFGFIGIPIWIIQMAWTPFWAAGVINGIGHCFGYRTFSTKDASTNIIPIGIIVGGEELHNNHHAFPRSAKLSFKKGEFDIGWMYIRILEFFGFAKVIERSPKPEGIRKHFVLTDIFSVKMRVLRKYEKAVMKKVAKRECAKPILNKKIDSNGKFKKWWTRDVDILTKDCKDYLSEVLSDKKQMQTIYNLRTKLVDAWQGIGYDVKQRIAILHNWCEEAEKIDNKYLQKFVKYFRKKIPSSNVNF